MIAEVTIELLAAVLFISLLGLICITNDTIMKQKKFLNFVTFLIDPECPWATSVVKNHKSYIEVMFITSCIVRPSDLGWLNTHAIGGEWFVTSEDEEIHIVVRFHNDDEEL